MHYPPKARVLICEPRCELYSWTNAGREFHRIEIAGEPITCAWRSAKDAWSAALRALNLNSSPFRAEELFKVVNQEKRPR